LLVSAFPWQNRPASLRGSAPDPVPPTDRAATVPLSGLPLANVVCFVARVLWPNTEDLPGVSLAAPSRYRCESIIAHAEATPAAPLFPRCTLPGSCLPAAFLLG
jgi:hypothetical protein